MDTRRSGDTRPIEQDEPLTFLPAEHRPIRWLPKHGEPFCIVEWASQHAIKALAHLPVYTAVIATLTFLFVVLAPWID